ncbi:MAG: hypothetical protein ACHQJ6_07900 [Candidatus Berkiellales bacterium]
MSAPDIVKQLREHYPVKELYRFFYRFFAGSERFYSGWQTGELTEPGFLRACLFTFFNELNFLHEDLSPEVIDRIHHNAISGVLKTNYSPDDFENNQTSFREPSCHVQFGLIPKQNLSEKGLKELLQEIPNKDGYTLKQEEDRFFLVCLSHKVKKRVAHIVAKYHVKMKKAATDDEKYAIICKMVSRLERHHPFKDGNCRSICIIILLRELIRNGMLPTIMDDPNQFDGYAQEQLIEKIKIGQKRFQELLFFHKLSTPFQSQDQSEYNPDGTAFNGVPDDENGSLIYQLIVESAFRQLDQQLVDRIKESFPNDLIKTLADLGVPASSKLISVALYFGADYAIDVLLELMRQSKTKLSDWQFELEGRFYSPIAFCLKIGRPTFAQKLITLMAEEESDLMECFAQDVALASKNEEPVEPLLHLFNKGASTQPLPSTSSKFISASNADKQFVRTLSAVYTARS